MATPSSTPPGQARATPAVPVVEPPAEPVRLGLLDATPDPRVGDRLATRSLVFDVLIALLFVALGLVLLQIFTREPNATDRLFVIGVNLPLALRRRWPVAALLLSFGFGLAQIGVGAKIGMHDGGLLFAIYSAVGVTGPRFGLVALVLGVVAAFSGAATGWWSWVDRQLMPNPGPGTRVASTIGALVLVGASWALGRRLHTSRLGAIALAERAERVQREQRQQLALAAADERARIAREMHDVIAHGLSTMVVQADAAGYVVDRSPEQARAALAAISAAGRESMAQMRNLLGLLREGGDTSRSATPDLDALPALVAQARSAGADVTFQPVPGIGPVPALTALTAYRIVQESLTNARKHGGAEVGVRLAEQVGTGSRRLLVTVDNAPAGSHPTLTGVPGHGLNGLRERVAAVDGSLATELDARGWFVVTATLPLP